MTKSSAISRMWPMSIGGLSPDVDSDGSVSGHVENAMGEEEYMSQMSAMVDILSALNSKKVSLLEEKRALSSPPPLTMTRVPPPIVDANPKSRDLCVSKEKASPVDINKTMQSMIDMLRRSREEDPSKMELEIFRGKGLETTSCTVLVPVTVGGMADGSSKWKGSFDDLESIGTKSTDGCTSFNDSIMSASPSRITPSNISTWSKSPERSKGLDAFCAVRKSPDRSKIRDSISTGSKSKSSPDRSKSGSSAPIPLMISPSPISPTSPGMSEGLVYSTPAAVEENDTEMDDNKSMDSSKQRFFKGLKKRFSGVSAGAKEKGKRKDKFSKMLLQSETTIEEDEENIRAWVEEIPVKIDEVDESSQDSQTVQEALKDDVTIGSKDESRSSPTLEISNASTIKLAGPKQNEKDVHLGESDFNPSKTNSLPDEKFTWPSFDKEFGDAQENSENDASKKKLNVGVDGFFVLPATHSETPDNTSPQNDVSGESATRTQSPSDDKIGTPPNSWWDEPTAIDKYRDIFSPCDDTDKTAEATSSPKNATGANAPAELLSPRPSSKATRRHSGMNNASSPTNAKDADLSESGDTAGFLPFVTSTEEHRPTCLFDDSFSTISNSSPDKTAILFDIGRFDTFHAAGSGSTASPKLHKYGEREFKCSTPTIQSVTAALESPPAYDSLEKHDFSVEENGEAQSKIDFVELETKRQIERLRGAA